MLLFIGIKEGLLHSNESTRMCEGKVPTKALGQKRERKKGRMQKSEKEEKIHHRQVNIDL
jgi:hypothetical protein